MNSKHLLFALVATCGLGFTACDEDDSQIIDLEPNDEQLLVTSNTTGRLIKIQTSDLGSPDRKDIALPFADAEGIAVRGDDAYVINRTDNRVVLLGDAFDDDNEVSARIDGTSTFNVPSGRGLAIDRELGGTNIAVSQQGTDANNNVNKIFLLRGNGDDISLNKEVIVPFSVWGIEWVGEDLLVVKDKSDSIAVYENFDDVQSGTVQPSYYFRVAGLTRTHGITYEPDDDILILTDIGDAMSDSDGAIHVVPNWKGAASNSAKTDKLLGADRQRRISGPATLLGNPVDVAYDDDNNRIYVAERAKDGGRVLGFAVPDANGSPAPVFNQLVPGASSVAYRD